MIAPSEKKGVPAQMGRNPIGWIMNFTRTNTAGPVNAVAV
jgi:hypothetical protein